MIEKHGTGISRLNLIRWIVLIVVLALWLGAMLLVNT